MGGTDFRPPVHRHRTQASTAECRCHLRDVPFSFPKGKTQWFYFRPLLSNSISMPAKVKIILAGSGMLATRNPK